MQAYSRSTLRSSVRPRAFVIHSRPLIGSGGPSAGRRRDGGSSRARRAAVRLDHVRVDAGVVVVVGIVAEDLHPVGGRERAVRGAVRVVVEELVRDAADDRVEDDRARGGAFARPGGCRATSRPTVSPRSPRSPRARCRRGARRRTAGSCSRWSRRSSTRPAPTGTRRCDRAPSCEVSPLTVALDRELRIEPVLRLHVHVAQVEVVAPVGVGGCTGPFAHVRIAGAVVREAQARDARAGRRGSSRTPRCPLRRVERRAHEHVALSRRWSARRSRSRSRR